MAQRSLYINGEQIYLKKEPVYENRLEVVNGLLEKYPEAFNIDTLNEQELIRNSARLDFLSFYLLYDSRDPNILSYAQYDYIFKNETLWDE